MTTRAQLNQIANDTEYMGAGLEAFEAAKSLIETRLAGVQGAVVTVTYYDEDPGRPQFLADPDWDDLGQVNEVVREAMKILLSALSGKSHKKYRALDLIERIFLAHEDVVASPIGGYDPLPEMYQVALGKVYDPTWVPDFFYFEFPLEPVTQASI